MTSPFENLAGPGKPLAVELADVQEIRALAHSGRVRLVDAHMSALSDESRFDLAYNAAHALCLAALRHKGYRASNRYIVFQLLPHTLGLGPEIWRVLARAHEIRNRNEYEVDAVVDQRFMHELIAAAQTVADALRSLDLPQ